MYEHIFRHTARALRTMSHHEALADASAGGEGRGRGEPRDPLPPPLNPPPSPGAPPTAPHGGPAADRACAPNQSENSGFLADEMAEVAAALAEVDTALPVARLRGEMLARAWAYLTARLTMLAVWQREAAERKRREFFAALAASERARDKPAPVVVVEVWSPLHRFLTSGGLGRCVLHPFSGLSNWEAGRQEAATFLHGKGKLTYLATIADANAMIAELNRSAGGSLGDPRSMLDDDTRAVVQVPELKPGDLFFFGQFAGVVLYAGVHTSHFTRVLSMGRNEPWIEHGLPAITPAVET